MNLVATMRRLWMTTACACLMSGLTGCMSLHHSPKLMLLTVWRAPVELETSPGTPPMVETPEVELPEVPLAAAGGRLPPVRRRRSANSASSAGANGAAAQAAAADSTEPEPVDIGELTAGGEAAPQARQEAVELIASTDQRLKALSSATIGAHRAQIGRVRNFQQQAQRALASGDADGARTLATKGKLLLDDLLK